MREDIIKILKKETCSINNRADELEDLIEKELKKRLEKIKKVSGYRKIYRKYN